MFRSLIAVVVAVVIGLTAAKFVEGVMQTMAPVQSNPPSEMGATASFAYQAGLLLAWMIGAFAAAATALLIGRRWAPLGALAAATIFFAAGLALASHALSWVLWPASAVAAATGGYAAIRLLRATSRYRAVSDKQEFFHD